MASNLRRCSNACEITCWNGGKVRVAFVIDAFAREVIAHVAVTGVGISGCDVRDTLLAAIAKASTTICAPCCLASSMHAPPMADRLAALLNRARRAAGLEPVSRKRVARAFSAGTG